MVAIHPTRSLLTVCVAAGNGLWFMCHFIHDCALCVYSVSAVGAKRQKHVVALASDNMVAAVINLN